MFSHINTYGSALNCCASCKVLLVAKGVKTVMSVNYLQTSRSLQQEHRPELQTPVCTLVPYGPAPGCWVTTGLDMAVKPSVLWWNKPGQWEEVFFLS